MKHAATFAVLVIVTVLPGFGQTPTQTDSQTLQAILAEIRGLHNDVRLSQTTQILLTELELQQTAVNRAMQKRDDAKNRVTQLQENEKNFTAQMARFDDAANATTDPQQKKQLSQQVEQLKNQLTGFKTQEQDRASDLVDNETALRREQDTLAGIQEQLNAVVKKMQPVSP
jgi:DNA repair exonuclease SbcCD ATPase subunit